MPQDAFTLKYLCEELNTLCAESKVNKITQPLSEEVVLFVYTKTGTKKLVLDVNPANPRVYIGNEEKNVPLTAPNFCMLLRKHLSNATLKSIKIVGFDRIVKIDFISLHEFAGETYKTLYVELMGRYSNIILTENGKVLGGNRGINFFDNGVRPLIVGRDYTFPPCKDKIEPDHLLSVKDKFFTQGSLQECIFNNVCGLAQNTAKEMVLSFCEKYGVVEGQALEFAKNNFEKFALFVKDFSYNAKAKPCVVFKEGKAIDFCVFPYKNQEGEVMFFDTLYTAENFYFEKKLALKRFTEKKDRLTNIVNTAVKKVKKKLSALCSKLEDASCKDENRIKGEILIANIYKLKGGEKQIVLDNYYDGTKITIALDEFLSPQKNAENYFKKYNKQKRTVEMLSPQKEQAQEELNYLNSVLDEIAIAVTIEDLSSIKEELFGYGLIQEQKRSSKKKAVSPYRIYNVQGITVKCGKNNIENDELTFSARGEYLWLHAKDYHSTHTIIEKNVKDIPSGVIEIASEITAYYCKARDGGKIDVVYTEKKNVKKPRKAKPGFVVYDNFKSITVCGKKHEEYLKI